jgi:PAS domain S-box-containing protein
VPPESVDELPQILARIGRGERIAHYETTRIGKDGRRIQVSLTISPLTDAHGNIVGASTIARDITDRKRAEDEVRKEKDYTQSIIRSMADMLVVVSPDGTIVTVNETTCRSLGYLEEDLIGQPATLLFVEEEEEEEEDNPQLILSQHALPVKRTVLRRLVKQGSVRNIEKSLQTKGGDWIPVLLSGAVIRDDEGEIRGIVCVALDITERRRVEEALRASERFVQGILRAAPNLIYIYDLQDRCNVYTNRSSLDFLGYTPEDIRTMGPALFQTILHPDDANRVAQHHARLAMGDAEVFEIEYRMRHASGQWRWLRSCDVLFARSERGLARQILGFAEDITERKRAEDSLRESEERFRSLIESAPEAIFVQSAGRFDYLNPAACRLLGASRPEDLLGKKFMERMVPEYRDAIRERVRLQRATGMLSPLMEQEYLRLDGSRVPVETTAVSIRYPGEDAHLVFVRDITERKRAEEALRESEERFRRTFDQAPIGAAIVSLDYRFVRVNEAMCRITGYSAEELTTLTFRDITHPDDLAADLKQVRQLVNGAIDQYVTEKRYIRKSGDIVWGHLSVRLLRNATGQPLYFLPMVQDITERRQVDAALSESEERLRLASQSAGIGIWEWHPDTGDVHWSEHVPAVVGVPAAYFKGGNVKALDDLLHPDERPGFWKAFQEAIDSRSRFDREFRIVLPDGKTRWLENLAHMYYDDAGKPLKMIGTVTDITARKRAEEALRESEAKYRNLVETTHDLVWALDTDGRVTFINQAAEQVYGRLPKELLGHSFFDFIVPEEREKTRAGFQAAVAAGQGAQDAECEVLHADGTRRLLLAKSIILRDHQGRVVGFFGTSQDITERRQAEERLAALEIQLTHASRLATLGELAAGIAHEVNQPLCAIVNFAKACKNTASHEAPDLLQIREWCDSIAMAAARSGDIIRGMLGYARRHGSTRETVAIGQLVTDAMRLVRHETQTRKVALQQEMPGQGLAACVDPVQIHQVLVNLLRNAIEALGDTRPADRRVVVQARWVDGLVQVSVSDNGSGQPDAELPKMFEPFFTTKAQGLGMGLAISKTIIEDHGGRIWAEVNQSGGLTIHFTLPAGKDKPQDVPKQNGVCD